MPEPDRLRWHEDLPAFRDLLGLTAAETGFLVRLVEKDYFCSVILQYLAGACPDLVFKGGTCLAKVHTAFHRLSEGLDFTLPVPSAAPRSARSRLARDLKAAMADLDRRVSGLRTLVPLRGANNSTQYDATVAYAGVAGSEETIKIEVGLREPLLMPAVRGEAMTLLLGPDRGRPIAPPLPLLCLSYPEAMAEKFRAALSRREPAIRDFYDVDHAAHRRGFAWDEPRFLALVREKLDVPGNPAVEVTPARLAALRSQRETALKPVLRAADLGAFDLDRAFGTVSTVAAAMGSA